MRSSDMKRKLSALFTTSPATNTNINDIHKMELDTEKYKVEQMLSEEYTAFNRTAMKDIGSTFDEDRSLKKTVNKLRSENMAKEKKAIAIGNTPEELKAYLLG